LVSCNTQKVTVKSAETKNKPKVKVFFLTGQSSMKGRKKIIHLTDEDKEHLEKTKQNVTLYYNHH